VNPSPSEAASEGELLRLAQGDQVLELAPHIGGSIARWYRQRLGDAPLHWLRPATAQALALRDPLGMGSFPLVPWCNRIRDGRSRHGARPIVLQPNFSGSPHAIHGVGWQRPWQVQERSAHEAVLALQHRPQPGAADWPYAFEALQRFVLGPDHLAVEISLRNLSDDAMPAGIGHHPYLPHTPGTRLQARVSAMWASDAELLPTGLVEPPFLREMAEGIELARLDLDNNFIGWRREARVEWPREGASLTMTAEAPLDFFVLYCPRGADHFVMEPVSNTTDWMNLAARGVGPVGGTMLAPGRTLSGRFELLCMMPADQESPA